MKKQRKPLGDSLAQEFVYGEATPAPVQPETIQLETVSEVKESVHPIQETSLMDKLQLDTEPREATIRFTVDLPESMHRKLSILSAKTGAKKAHIVRKLLEQVLTDIND